MPGPQQSSLISYVEALRESMKRRWLGFPGHGLAMTALAKDHAYLAGAATPRFARMPFAMPAEGFVLKPPHGPDECWVAVDVRPFANADCS